MICTGRKEMHAEFLFLIKQMAGGYVKVAEEKRRAVL
jgi:hypothetical protein